MKFSARKASERSRRLTLCAVRSLRCSVAVRACACDRWDTPSFKQHLHLAEAVSLSDSIGEFVIGGKRMAWFPSTGSLVEDDRHEDSRASTNANPNEVAMKTRTWFWRNRMTNKMEREMETTRSAQHISARSPCMSNQPSRSSSTSTVHFSSPGRR
ncbi:hypothetical protein T10_4703 [Trichinella papuae]|uniref:Uncharacterized protein n=1 Tax=Trichinella papuae TaxID=268474 RepID=A0A0V1MPA2_9BILA|nr:hypothetical protein T10_4703 [Trichinella papuae]